MDNIALYIESLLPEKKTIKWNEEIKKFIISYVWDLSVPSIREAYIRETGYTSMGRFAKVYSKQSLGPIEFYREYKNTIKTSPYYTEFMAQILGSHANT